MAPFPSPSSSIGSAISTGLLLSAADLRGGVVFKLSLANGRWRESVLYNFLGGSDGQYPSSSLLLDSSGNLYGTTFSGRIQSSGSVFMLTPTSAGWKGNCAPRLHRRARWLPTRREPDIRQIRQNLRHGRVWREQKGGAGFGVVYGLSSNTQGQWKETVLHTFEGGVDGANPSSGVTFDTHGNLYGTTEGPYTGCAISACGQVFQLMDTLGTWKIQNVYPLPSELTSLGGLTRAAKSNFFSPPVTFRPLTKAVCTN